MSGPPQPTHILIKRLFRIANKLRIGINEGLTVPQMRAFANTCDQAAGRLTEYLQDFGTSRTEQAIEEDDGTSMSADEKVWLG